MKLAQYGLSGRFPDVVWDGIVNKDLLVDGDLPLDQSICIPDVDVVMLNIDMGNNFANVTEDMKSHRCSHEKLAPVSLDLAG
ncbi:MAG TPA: hypothetical protein DEQ32_03845 [Gammaproteobacteria bacterium]|nr:hypothetical protein [Gammaproteobacteria bacterium]